MEGRYVAEEVVPVEDVDCAEAIIYSPRSPHISFPLLKHHGTFLLPQKRFIQLASTYIQPLPLPLNYTPKPSPYIHRGAKSQNGDLLTAYKPPRQGHIEIAPIFISEFSHTARGRDKPPGAATAGVVEVVAEEGAVANRGREEV